MGEFSLFGGTLRTPNSQRPILCRCEELPILGGPYSSQIICLGRPILNTDRFRSCEAFKNTEHEPARDCTAGGPAQATVPDIRQTRLAWTPHGRDFCNSSARQ